MQLMDPPEPSVAITPQRRDAPAEPGKNVTVTFGGYLEVTQPRTMTSTTTVLVTVSRGWRGSASPNMFTRTGTFDDTFSISVEVPFDAEAHMVSDMVVTASSLASGHTAVEASANGAVGVEQYYGVAISTDHPHSEVRKDETAHFSCTVNNYGNGVTNIRLVSDYPDTMGVSLDTSELTIGPWRESDVPIVVYLDPDIAPGIYKVVVTAEAIDNLGGVSSLDSVELTVEVLTWIESTPTLWLTVMGAMAVISIAAVVLIMMRWRSRRKAKGMDGPLTPE